MIEELNAASSHLRAALKRYMSACSVFQSCLIQGNIINSHVPQGLSGCIGNELLHISSYERDIKQAKAAMSLSRNCLSTIVPINVLPSEILGYIFELVIDTQPCSLHGVIARDLGKPPPTDLDQLLLVCTRWRQVAISSHALWSHIDVAPGCSFSQGLLSRAQAYAARAGQSFLDIHIVNLSRTSAQSEYTTLAQFLTSVATHTRSLVLKTGPGSSTPIDFYRSVFHSCFVTCAPGAFTQLAIENDFYFKNGFNFIGTAEDTNRSALQLDLPQTHLEDIWLSVKVLHLTGLFLHWTSKAYHGLVDLRLLSEPGATKITESQLVKILTASPKLHTLHFGIELARPLQRDNPTVLVQLKDLEVLVWTPDLSTSDEPGTFLQWLAPGSKPLQLSIQNHVEDDEDEALPVLVDNRIREFFARSTITKLHFRCPDIHISVVTELLDLMPSLQVLALDQSGRKRRHTAPSGPGAQSTRLDTLYLVDSSINLDELQEVIQKHSVQALILSDCIVHRNNRSGVFLDEEEVEPQLHAICPSFKFSKSNPIQDWDHLVEW